MTKIFHIIENFNGQAIESWLLKMLSNSVSTKNNFSWTFYSILGQAGKYDYLVQDLGAEIIYAPYPMRKRYEFLKALRKVMIAGKYDILHCHHDVVSAVYLLASIGIPFKKRIVHIHNTSLSLPTSNKFKAAILQEPMRQFCLYSADQIVGISNDALEVFLNGRKATPKRDRVIHCGIDTLPFHQSSSSPAKFRESLALPENAKVLLFVGRMIEYKNPIFIIEILEHLLVSNLDVVAVFAGSGPLEDEVMKKAEQKSLEKEVRVLGWRDDIPVIMQNSNLLIWPGLENPKEGLGLGVVEAQAAGLPVLMSLSVPKESIVMPELVNVLPLAAGAQMWADKVIQILNLTKPNKVEALACIESSSFSISQSMSNIAALYNDI